jgi:hypothetical protein
MPDGKTLRRIAREWQKSNRALLTSALADERRWTEAAKALPLDPKVTALVGKALDADAAKRAADAHLLLSRNMVEANARAEMLARRSVSAAAARKDVRDLCGKDEDMRAAASAAAILSGKLDSVGKLYGEASRMGARDVLAERAAVRSRLDAALARMKLPSRNGPAVPLDDTK